VCASIMTEQVVEHMYEADQLLRELVEREGSEAARRRSASMADWWT